MARPQRYSEGMVALRPGSRVVVGTGTSWRANVFRGQGFVVPGLAWALQIDDVMDDRTLTLTGPVPGKADRVVSGLSYFVTMDFSPVLNLPLPDRNSPDGQSLVNAGLVIVDRELGFAFASQ